MGLLLNPAEHRQALGQQPLSLTVLPLGFPVLRTAAPLGKSCCGRRDGHAGRGGLPHQGDLCRGEGVGLVDEVAEGALQGQGFGGEGAGRRDGAGVFLSRKSQRAYRGQQRPAQT